MCINGMLWKKNTFCVAYQNSSAVWKPSQLYFWDLKPHNFPLLGPIKRFDLTVGTLMLMLGYFSISLWQHWLCGAWLQHIRFKRGTNLMTLMDFRGHISQWECIPLSCSGTDRGWPNNLPIPLPRNAEMTKKRLSLSSPHPRELDQHLCQKVHKMTRSEL